MVAAYAKLDEKFKPLVQEIIKLDKNLKELLLEIKTLSVGCFSREVAEKLIKNLNEKVEAYTSLFNQYKIKVDELRVIYEKRESELTEKMNKKIAEALKQFAEKNGY